MTSNKVKLKIVSQHRQININGINLEFEQWTPEIDKSVLTSFDIGIMPMPDTKWTRGKCAFKAILYMSVGIPCVSSPVGVTVDIIKDGINGFLADSIDEWKDKLSALIESQNLRTETGENGRKTVEEKYSVKANEPKFLEVLNRIKD